MKKVVLTAVASVVLGLAIGWFAFRPSVQTGASKERKILYYRDPMNPQITSETPKKSSDGMDFVPVYAEGSGEAGERKIAYYKDPMHPWYTSDKPGKAPDCGMDLVPVYEGDTDTKGIRIDPATVQNIGVKVEDVVRRKMTKVIRTVGKVDYDERRLFSVNTKIMGWVERLYVDYTGKVVRKGEPLMELYSPELVTTQEEYLQALSYRKKLQESSLEEARKGSDDLLQSARRRLLNWDIPEREIQALEQRGTPTKTMTIYSPADGVVIEKMVSAGQNVMAGMELYKIADPSSVWVLADVYQYELPWVRLGDNVDIELSYLPGKTFRGRISYMYPYLNDETKTVKVRVQVPNSASLELKPDMFATVKIATPVSVDAVVVPDQAIIRSGERNIAVIALGGGYFEPRDVKLGLISEGYVQVLDGIHEGEKIVVSSQFLIDSESNLKAAISQMTSHGATPAGQDSTSGRSGGMSLPMGEPSKSSASQSGHDMNSTHARPEGGTSTSPDMKDMHGAKNPANHEKKAGTAQAGKMIDLVCGMEASGDQRLSSTYNGHTYFFCSESDMEKFRADPVKYVK